MLFLCFSDATVLDGDADEATIDYGECYPPLSQNTAVPDDTRETTTKGIAITLYQLVLSAAMV